LDRLGVAVRAQPIDWSPRRAALDAEEAAILDRLTRAPLDSRFVHVQHIFPTAFHRDPAAVASIGRTMFETDRIPASWVERCNAMDEVWVPSDFNLETFARSGVEPRKLRKLPGAIDAERFRTPVSPLPFGPNGHGFRFLSIFDWSLRKGWDVLLRAFVEEFQPAEDVCLGLKLYSSSGAPDTELVERVRGYVHSILGSERAPRIVILGGTLDDLQMRRLYRASDAYVMPSRGEGWGRPLMEAMASGLPTIGTNWSGSTEFMTPDNAYLVDYELVSVSPEAVAEAAHFAGQRWAEPSVTHLRALMREVFGRPDSARARAERGRAEVLEGYDRAAVARLAAGHLERLLGRPVARHDDNEPRGRSVEPLRLDGRRRVAFLHQPEWQAAEWEDVVVSYARAFRPGDDTTLVLWLDPDQGLTEAAAGERVLSTLIRADIDPANMADMLLLPDPLDALGKERLYAAVDWIVPTRHRSPSGRAGVRMLHNLDAATWRAAAA
jgi:glycosyltransferase involved in cell wall biosynthesis